MHPISSGPERPDPTSAPNHTVDALPYEHESHQASGSSRAPTLLGSVFSVGARTAQTRATTPEPPAGSIAKPPLATEFPISLDRLSSHGEEETRGRSATADSKDAATDRPAVDSSNHASTTRDQPVHMSEDPVSQPVPTDPKSELAKVLQSLSNLTRVREKLFIEQSSLEQERSKAFAAQDFLEESQKEIMLALKDLVTSDNMNEKRQELSVLYERAQGDSDLYRDQTEKVKTFEVTVKNLEYSLWNLDQDLYKFIRESFPDLPAPPPATPDGVVPMDQVPLLSPPPNGTPSTLKAYWNSLGTADALKDDLFDLDQSHQQESAELESLCDRGQIPSRPPSEVDREYEHKRHSLLEQMVAIETEALLLRERCVAKNIDPDIPRKVASVASSPVRQPSDNGLLGEPLVSLDAIRSRAAGHDQLPQVYTSPPPDRDTSPDSFQQTSLAQMVTTWLSHPEIGQDLTPIEGPKVEAPPPPRVLKKFDPAAF